MRVRGIWTCQARRSAAVSGASRRRTEFAKASFRSEWTGNRVRAVNRPDAPRPLVVIVSRSHVVAEVPPRSLPGKRAPRKPHERKVVYGEECPSGVGSHKSASQPRCSARQPPLEGAESWMRNARARELPGVAQVRRKPDVQVAPLPILTERTIRRTRAIFSVFGWR